MRDQFAWFACFVIREKIHVQTDSISSICGNEKGVAVEIKIAILHKKFSMKFIGGTGFSCIFDSYRVLVLVARGKMFV